MALAHLDYDDLLADRARHRVLCWLGIAASVVFAPPGLVRFLQHVAATDAQFAGRLLAGLARLVERAAPLNPFLPATDAWDLAAVGLGSGALVFAAWHRIGWRTQSLKLTAAEQRIEEQLLDESLRRRVQR